MGSRRARACGCRKFDAFRLRWSLDGDTVSSPMGGPFALLIRQAAERAVPGRMGNRNIYLTPPDRPGCVAKFRQDPELARCKKPGSREKSSEKVKGKSKRFSAEERLAGTRYKAFFPFPLLPRSPAAAATAINYAY